MYEDDEEVPVAPQQPRGALGASAAYEPEMDADPDEIQKILTGLTDPSAQWLHYSAGALKPAAGGFGESMGNALGALAGARDKNAELKARYLPLAESAVLRRQQAELQRMRLQQQQSAAWSEVLNGTAASMLTVPGDFSKEDLLQALRGPVSQGRVPPQVAQQYFESLPEDPAALRAYITRSAIAAKDPYRAVAQNKPVALVPGGKLVDPVTGKEIAANDRSDKPPEFAMLLAERDKLPPNDSRRALYDQMLTKLSTHAPGTSVSVNTGEKGFKNELQLKSDFRAEPIYKDHSDMTSAYGQIVESLKQDTPIADVAAATKIMKLLDPGSVVRESELGIAMAAAGKFDRLSNFIGMWLKGDKLTPQQRKDFGALAAELYRASAKVYNQKRSEYKALAEPYGVKTDAALGPEAKEPSAPMPKKLTAAEALRLYGGAQP